jgi:enoyl-CoA hydratase/carnithine racemase
MNERHPDGQISMETRGGVLLIGIDRPEKRNGFTPKMFAELSAAYTQLDEDPALRVGVVFGHGAHTTAGLELPKFVAAMQSGHDPFDLDGVDPFGLKRKCRKPLVCALQGICFTVAIELALACDIVVAASDCRLSQLEAKRGIMPFGGATFRLVQRCGWGNAQYHLLRADEFDAAEAHRIGLVQEVVAPGEQVERAIALAEEIAANAPLAIQASKASSMTYVEQGEAACVAGFTEIIQRLSATDDAAEGVMAFIERRPPLFTGK